MAGQWSQRFHPPNNHNFANYQQQFPQQRPQQQSPQQYGPPHNGAYATRFQPSAHPQPQHSQPDPNSCYNCGSPDHWAQDCPEPRREVPVGQIYRQNFARPPKRHKPNAPIITKYPFPPHVQHGHGPSYGYSPGTYGQPHYSTHQIPYGPPTPMSAQSPSQIQWQQSPLYQSYQQPYPHENHYQPNSHTQHSYPTPTAQTPGSFFGSHPSSHQPSPQAPPYHSANYPPYSQSQHSNGYQGQPYAGASPNSMTSPANAYTHKKYYEGFRRASENKYHSSYQTNRFTNSYPQTTKTQLSRTLNTELEESDLNKLDIPDMPPSSVFLTDQTILKGASSFRLVQTPLPADFIVAEANSPLGLAKHEDEGRCQSKYCGPGALSNIFQNIRESSDWDDLSEDPIFLSIGSDSELIPLEDLVTLYNPREARDDDQQIENETDKALHEHSSPKSDSNAWDVMESLENALNVGRSKPTESTSSTSSTLKDQSQPFKDAEEVLASPGVPSAPKAARANLSSHSPPSPVQERMASPDHSPRPQSSTLLTHDIYDSNYENLGSNSGVSNDFHNREWKETSRHLDPSDTKSDFPLENTLPGLNSYRSADDFYPNQYDLPPPPPPPPARKLSSAGASHSPASAGPNSNNHSSLYDPNTSSSTNHDKYTLDVHSTSPSKLRSDRLNPRKREYDQRDSSEESSTPGRRQADDVTPKLKKRQPKVAEAYSRRW